jgi:signal transduction histidine kinase
METAHTLTRTQFNDHIPTFLDGLERKLRSNPGSARDVEADVKIERGEVLHGRERWQQGYTLLELMHEWGNLQVVLFDEIEAFADAHPDWPVSQRIGAHRLLVQLITEGITESVNQYARVERAEAEGLVLDLEGTVSVLQELETRRTQLIHQAVHDLRGNVQTVTSAAEVLRSPQIAEDARVEFATLLQQGVETVSSMLGDLLELARLEAGHEKRQIAPFDGAHLVAELCRRFEPVAVERNLYLHASGQHPLPVEGDADKIRRLLQNLLLNALKYTTQGGVTVTWGEETKNWWVKVKDTGPGLLSGPVAQLAVELKGATIAAHETDVQAPIGESNKVLDQAKAGPGVAPRADSHAGEGIGLSIVKRLCELLNASLELTSSTQVGTTIRVLLPKTY